MSEKQEFNNKSTEELQLLREIDRAILSSAIDLEQTLRAILDGGLRLIGAKHGHIMLVEGEDLVIKVTTTQVKQQEVGTRLKTNESVSGLSVIRKEAVLIPDVDAEPLYRRVLLEEYMRSELAVPLIEDERVIGVLNIESSQPNAFTEHDKELLETLANQAAIAVKNARSNEELKALREIDRAILSSAIDLEQTLRAILDGGLRLIGAKHGHIMLVEGEDLVIKVTTTQVKQQEVGTRLKTNESVSGLSVIRKEAVLIPDVDAEPLYRRVLLEEYMRSELAVPLIEDERVIGVLNIESSQPNAFTEHDKELLETLANQAAIAVKNARSNKILKELQKVDLSILNSAADLNATFHTILNAVVRLVNADFCDILTIEGKELVIRASTLDTTFFRDKLDLDNSVTGLVVKQLETIYIPDVDNQPLYQKGPAQNRMRSELVVPMIDEESIVGILNVESARPNAFNTQDKSLIEALAHKAAIAIKSAQFAEELKQRDLIKASAETAQWLTHKIGNLALSIEWPAERLRESIDESNESALEDLQMIQDAARNIVVLKTELIKPLKSNQEEPIYIEEIFDEVIRLTNIPSTIVSKSIIDNLPYIRASRIDMLNIFSELLDNSMNALENTNDRKIELAAYLSDKSDYVVVKVADNGCGISSENLDRIYALGFTTKSNQGGTGFGMYNCAQIVHRIDAQIFVESEINQGTTFTLQFPIWE